MPEEFDPYLQWLGIRDESRPPNHYRLLGIAVFEPDANVIANAADRQMAHVRTFQSGPYAQYSQQLLNELSAARICLLQPERKATYDARLREQLLAKRSASRKPVPPTIAVAEPMQPAAADAVSELADFTSSATHSASIRRRQPAKKQTSAGGWLALAGMVALAALCFLLVHWKYNVQPLAEVSPASKPPAPKELGKTANASTITTPSSQPSIEAPLTNPPQSDDSNDDLTETSQSPDREDVAGAVELSEVATQSLQATRQALGRRDLAQAHKQIELARAAGSSGDQTRIARLTTVVDLLDRFWAAVEDALRLLSPGDELTLGGDVLKVTQLQDEMLWLQQGAQRPRRFSIRVSEIDSALAAALAMRELKESGSDVNPCLGAFWGMDSRGDRREARRLWELAARQGAPIESLLAELELAVPTEAPAASEVEAPVASIDVLVPASGLDTRPAIPDAEDQRLARQKIEETFRAELKGANKPDKQSELAKALLTTAVESDGAAANQFVLLKHAEELALKAGDVSLVVEVVDQRSKRFAVDGLQQKADALSAIAKLARGAAVNQMLLDAASQLSRDAVAADRYETASQLVRLVVAAAKNTKNLDARKDAAAQEREVKDLGNAYKAALHAVDQLRADPDDADASLKVGRYLCFTRKDWQRGLPLLAKGSDEKLRSAANLDLAKPTQAAGQLAVADAWWDCGEAVKTFKAALVSRAQHWYQQALAGGELEKLDSVRVQRRLAALESTGGNDAAAAGPTLQIALSSQVKLTLRRIKPGKFMMGSPPNEPGRKANETLHQVTISRPFYIGTTEVTQAQWQVVMGQNSSVNRGDANLPVEKVCVEDCQTFCSKLQSLAGGTKYRFRLPTEAEWEYACRAGSSTMFFFGNDASQLENYAWFLGNSGEKTHPVGQLKPNPWGLFDIYGNVGEWCADYLEDYPAQSQVDPINSRSGPQHVQRGGSFWEEAPMCGSARRFGPESSARYKYLGLRIVVEVR